MPRLDETEAPRIDDLPGAEDVHLVRPDGADVVERQRDVEHQEGPGGHGLLALSRRTGPTWQAVRHAMSVVHFQAELRGRRGKRELRVFEARRPHEALGVVRCDRSFAWDAEEARVELPVLVLVVEARDRVRTRRNGVERADRRERSRSGTTCAERAAFGSFGKPFSELNSRQPTWPLLFFSVRRIVSTAFAGGSASAESATRLTVAISRTHMPCSSAVRERINHMLQSFD